MALTPWPKNEPELTAAVQSLAAAAFGDSAKDRIKAQRLGPVGSDLVEKYSPHAPQSVRDEAVILVVSLDRSAHIRTNSRAGDQGWRDHPIQA